LVQSVAVLHFAAPLPDDSYTLTISDHILDDAGNSLDEEFNGVSFPTGNGNPGGALTSSFERRVPSQPDQRLVRGIPRPRDRRLGGQYWLAQMQQGVAQDQVQAAVLASDEFVHRAQAGG
jgi:hypothetical protein